MLACFGFEGFRAHPLDPHTDSHPSILIEAFKKLIAVVGVRILKKSGNVCQWIFPQELLSAIEHPVVCSDKTMMCNGSKLDLV